MYYIVRMEYTSGFRWNRGTYYYWAWDDIVVEEICKTKEIAETNMENHWGMTKAKYEIIELDKFCDFDYMITFGKYKGKMLKDVGISYQLWLYNRGIVVNDQIKTLLIKHGILKSDHYRKVYNEAVERFLNREEAETRAWDEMIK